MIWGSSSVMHYIFSEMYYEIIKVGCTMLDRILCLDLGECNQTYTLRFCHS
uniref:Uncharacterized protein n=1 Tax=Aegilops tauschii subsp. strangulata TaxID=200361 RepID=A0A453GT84_AEGTS